MFTERGWVDMAELLLLKVECVPEMRVVLSEGG